VLTRGDGDAAYDLLQEFFAGYPVDRLQLLLKSENHTAVEAGAWIASELGDDAAAVLDDLVTLLEHPSATVRFYAADSIFGCARADRGDAIAEAIKLIDDPDGGVRWRVMDSMARTSRSKLLAGAAHLDGAEYPLLTMLRSDGDGMVEISARGSGREQRIAAATAGRLAVGGNDQFLKAIADNETGELKQFAVDLLRNIEISRGGGGQAQ